ncbi:MAG: cupin domain-containing protein, partial [Halanaerobiales bacterium]
NIAQEKSLPEHTHFDCTVFIQIISGKAEVNVDDEVIAMVENDLLQVDGDETMSVDNIGSTTLVLYVTISPLPPSEKYTENADF